MLPSFANLPHKHTLTQLHKHGKQHFQTEIFSKWNKQVGDIPFYYSLSWKEVQVFNQNIFHT